VKSNFRPCARYLPGLLFALVPTVALAGSDYEIVQSIPTAHGTLQILEDVRIGRALERKMWDGCIDVGTVLGEDDPRAKQFAKNPPLPASLRQIDRNGKTLVSIVPNKQAPIARIESKRFGSPADPVFLIETDDDACMGSYSGRGVQLYKFSPDRIAPVIATDDKGNTTAVYFFDSLKSAWRIVNASPAHTEIEQMLCRPDFAHDTGKGDMPFALRYITFRFDGTKWTKAERDEAGEWEDDDGFPNKSKFP
jgi:hypothetical protein